MTTYEKIEAELNEGLRLSVLAVKAEINKLQQTITAASFQHFNKEIYEINEMKKDIRLAKGQLSKNTSRISSEWTKASLDQSYRIDTGMINKMITRNSELAKLISEKMNLVTERKQQVQIAISLFEEQQHGSKDYIRMTSLRDLLRKLNERIDYNSYILLDYLYAVYQLSLGHDGNWSLYKPYYKKGCNGLTAEIESICADKFKWYMTYEQCNYAYDELSLWDTRASFSHARGAGVYEHMSKGTELDVLSISVNRKCSIRDAEELINRGGFFSGRLI